MNLNRLFNIIILMMPNMLMPLKTIIYKRIIKKHGTNFILNPSVIILNPESFEVGNDVFINRNFYCTANEGIFIGNRVMFGANCSIVGGDHSYSNPKMNMRFTSELGDNRKIIIEDDAWIGHGTVILKKAKIAEGCIVGANSLLNSDTRPYSVYAGQPARFIKPRFKSIEDLMTYLDMMKNKYNFVSRYSTDELQKIYQS